MVRSETAQRYPNIYNLHKKSLVFIPNANGESADVINTFYVVYSLFEFVAADDDGGES